MAYAFADLTDAFDGTHRNVFTRLDCAGTHSSSGVDGVERRQIDRAFPNPGGRAARTFRNPTAAVPTPLPTSDAGLFLGFLIFSAFAGGSPCGDWANDT